MIWLLFSFQANAGPCQPHEIFIRKQSVDRYIKSDGTVVSAHTRQAHCREMVRQNHFQDKTAQDFKGIKTNILTWKPNEKKAVEMALAKIPKWLQKYPFSEILRGDVGGHPLNAAATIPLTKTLLVFNQFFKSSNQKSILIHEAAHLAVYDFTPDEIMAFALASGWRFVGETRLPPLKLLKADSKDSVAEDFSNHIEEYYANEMSLDRFNSSTYLVLKKLISSKEAGL